MRLREKKEAQVPLQPEPDFREHVHGLGLAVGQLLRQPHHQRGVFFYASRITNDSSQRGSIFFKFKFISIQDFDASSVSVYFFLVVSTYGNAYQTGVF